MAIPQAYPIPPEAAIASYDYTDIAEGTGVVIFYPMNVNMTDTDYYILTHNVMYSNDIFSTATSNTTDYSEVLDLDFDVIFNVPKRIKGDIIISIPITTQRGPSYNHYTFAIIKARHVDAAATPVETELGSAQTEVVIGPSGASTYVDAVKTVKINIASVTGFKRGETLRITVGIWAKTVNAGEARAHAFGHDPKGRANATVFPTGITITEVHVPFVLDL